MNYTLKTEPTVVFTSCEPETHSFVEKKQFIIENNIGTESSVRIVKTRVSLNFEILIDGNWVLISDTDLLNWLFDNFS